MDSTSSSDHRLTPRSRLGPAGTLPFGNPQSSSTAHRCLVALGSKTVDANKRVTLRCAPQISADSAGLSEFAEDGDVHGSEIERHFNRKSKKRLVRAGRPSNWKKARHEFRGRQPFFATPCRWRLSTVL